EVNVEPDVELGPVGEGEHPDALPLVDLRVVQVPELVPLVLRVPLPETIAEAVDPLLGARALFVAPGAAERGVEAALPQRLQQRLRLHDRRVLLAAVIERIDVLREAGPVGVDDELEPVLPGEFVPEL